VLCLGNLLISSHTANLSGHLPDAGQACTHLRVQSLPVLVVSPTFTATKVFRRPCSAGPHACSLHLRPADMGCTWRTVHMR
jgi:hypothetical protein